MDANLVVLTGTLSAPPEHRSFPTGARLVRLLLTVRLVEPRPQIDVVPVTWWEPPENLDFAVGDRLWVAARLRRRFYTPAEGTKTSRLEVVAGRIGRCSEEADPGVAEVAEALDQPPGQPLEAPRPAAPGRRPRGGRAAAR